MSGNRKLHARAFSFCWPSCAGCAPVRCHVDAQAHGSPPGPSGGSRGLFPVRGRGSPDEAGGASAVGRADEPASRSRLPSSGGPWSALRCDLQGSQWLGLAAWRNGAFKCAPRDRWTGGKPERPVPAALDGGTPHPVTDSLRARGVCEPCLPFPCGHGAPALRRRAEGARPRGAAGGDVLRSRDPGRHEVEGGGLGMFRARRRGLPAPTGTIPIPTASPRRSSLRHRGPMPGRCFRARCRVRPTWHRPVIPDRRPPEPRGAALVPRRACGDSGLPPGAGKEAYRGIGAHRARACRTRRQEGQCRRRAVRAIPVPGGTGGRRRVAEPEDGASRARLPVHPPPGRPVGRPRGSGGRAPPAGPGPGFTIARALAADGKRIRGANRNGDGHHETVARVDPASGAPFALLNFDDGGGERAALHDLLERSDIGGRVIPLDALHTTRRTAKRITERADDVFVVKGNARRPSTSSTASMGRGTPPVASRRSSTKRTVDGSSVRSASSSRRTAWSTIRASVRSPASPVVGSRGRKAPTTPGRKRRTTRTAPVRRPDPRPPPAPVLRPKPPARRSAADASTSP